MIRGGCIQKIRVGEEMNCSRYRRVEILQRQHMGRGIIITVQRLEVRVERGRCLNNGKALRPACYDQIVIPVAHGNIRLVCPCLRNGIIGIPVIRRIIADPQSEILVAVSRLLTGEYLCGMTKVFPVNHAFRSFNGNRQVALRDRSRYFRRNQLVICEIGLGDCRAEGIRLIGSDIFIGEGISRKGYGYRAVPLHALEGHGDIRSVAASVVNLVEIRGHIRICVEADRLRRDVSRIFGKGFGGEILPCRRSCHGNV